MLLINSHLIGWIAGGLILLTSLLMRTTRRPYALAFALIGYGGAGFVAHGLGQPPLTPSLIGLVAMGALGYLLQPRRASHDAPPP
jgi:CHASE2 domain-containing sensor protein